MSQFPGLQGAGGANEPDCLDSPAHTAQCTVRLRAGQNQFSLSSFAGYAACPTGTTDRLDARTACAADLSPVPYPADQHRAPKLVHQLAVQSLQIIRASASAPDNLLAGDLSRQFRWSVLRQNPFASATQGGYADSAPSPSWAPTGADHSIAAVKIEQCARRGAVSAE